jgi:soluble P-type ATPase
LHWALDNATDPNGPPEILPFDVSSVRTLADKYELVTTEAAFLAAAQATALASEQQQQLRAGQARVVSIEEVVDSGDDFFAAAFTDHRCLWTMVDSFKVFARMSPQGKGLMIRAIQTTDPLAHVLMCGDGGNDVGALKQAAVGIALLVRAPLHFAFCILHFAFCILHFAFCILHFAFCILHFAFCILHFALCTLHFALLSPHVARESCLLCHPLSFCLFEGEIFVSASTRSPTTTLNQKG